MKIKVTFAKPKVKLAASGSEKASASDNFTKKNSQESREKKQKLENLENKVSEVYGSKAYKMLQKMSLKANKKDYDDSQYEAQGESSKVDDSTVPERKTVFSLG